MYVDVVFSFYSATRTLMSMRRTLVTLSALLLLTSCGGSGSSSSSSTTTCKDQYWDGEVGLCLPTGWTVVDRETLARRGVPEETVVAFQAEKALSGQYPTVTVTRETLGQNVESLAYSEASIRAVSTLPSYKRVDEKSVKIGKDKLNIHVFNSKPLPDEPERRFNQLSLVSGNTGYTITGLTPISVSSSLEKEIQTILQSIIFADPDAAKSE
jgi:hypothetical protein